MSTPTVYHIKLLLGTDIQLNPRDGACRTGSAPTMEASRIGSIKGHPRRKARPGAPKLSASAAISVNAPSDHPLGASPEGAESGSTIKPANSILPAADRSPITHRARQRNTPGRLSPRDPAKPSTRATPGGRRRNGAVSHPLRLREKPVVY